MFVKICGITRLSDARFAVEHGADALGFILWHTSPRYVRPEQAAEIIAALPASVTTVGVFVNESIDTVREIAQQTGMTTVQLHGEEGAAYAHGLEWPVWRAITVDDVDQAFATWPETTTFLLDAKDPARRGGTGARTDWRRAAAAAAARRVVLAGGLTAENVGEAIATVRPFGVDVSSGVEEAPGVKNLDKTARFLASARSAFEQRQNGHR